MERQVLIRQLRRLRPVPHLTAAAAGSLLALLRAQSTPVEREVRAICQVCRLHAVPRRAAIATTHNPLPLAAAAALRAVVCHQSEYMEQEMHTVRQLRWLRRVLALAAATCSPGALTTVA